MKQGNKQMGSEMDEGTARVYPKWFWVIAGCALIWNLMGFVIFYGETFQQEAVIAGFEPAQQEWMRSTPRWIYVVFGLSVGTGIVGSVLLLTKKKKLHCPLLDKFYRRPGSDGLHHVDCGWLESDGSIGSDHAMRCYLSCWIVARFFN